MHNLHHQRVGKFKSHVIILYITSNFLRSFQFLLRHPHCAQPASATSNLCFLTQVPGKPNHQLQGKMNIHLTLIAVVLISLHELLAIDVMPELKKNVLNFGYGANFKYEGMLTHSFDRFYVVVKYEIPKVENLMFTTFSFGLTCNHLNISKKSYLLRYIRHCRRIAPM